MTEIEQIAQEMDDSGMNGIMDWVARLRSLSASHRLLPLADIEQALEKAYEAGTRRRLISDGEKWHPDLTAARSLLHLPPAQEPT
jgi:hypothetical protein